MQFTQKSRSSLPLDRADGLEREVVTHAADAGDLGGGAGGDTLEQWPCTLESSGSAGQQPRPSSLSQSPSLGRPPPLKRPSSLRRQTGHGPTRGLEMSGGFSNIFQRMAVFESFRKQNQSNDARLSATHSYMSDFPPLVWTRIDVTTPASRLS